MKYKIRDGESFRDSDGTIKTGGQLIDLDTSMAQVHAALIHPDPVEPAQTPVDLPTISPEA